TQTGPSRHGAAVRLSSASGGGLRSCSVGFWSSSQCQSHHARLTRHGMCRKRCLKQRCAKITIQASRCLVLRHQSRRASTHGRTSTGRANRGTLTACTPGTSGTSTIRRTTTRTIRRPRWCKGTSSTYFIQILSTARRRPHIVWRRTLRATRPWSCGSLPVRRTRTWRSALSAGSGSTIGAVGSATRLIAACCSCTLGSSVIATVG
ncbi:hypothetical protein GGH20_005462, partial [Coemansia sp. RSA 1937]